MTPMPIAPDLERLAARCAADPGDHAFAALADALRKAGSLDDAQRVALAGVHASPDYVPGHFALARVWIARREVERARDELVAALMLDPGHPAVQRALEALPPEEGVRATDDFPGAAAPDRTEATLLGELPSQSPASTATTSPPPAVDSDFDDDDTFGSAADDNADDAIVLTESLAMLYREQGHLDRAVDVLEALVLRTPHDSGLVARRDTVRAERDARTPRPFDVRQTGGRSAREWLAAIAAVHSAPVRATSSFDAFYQPPAAPSADPGDPAAFQAWLKSLER